MKDLLRHASIDAMRDRSARMMEAYGGYGDETCGVFNVASPIDAAPMRVIASSEGGWEHVSVSRKNRAPNWAEMEYVKRMFFEADEVCMQLHVAVVEHINLHPHCLHIWRPNDGRAIPVPPSWMVGPSNSNVPVLLRKIDDETEVRR